MKKTLRSLLALALASLMALTFLSAVLAAAGDVDLDGKVTASDARLALRRAVNLETYEAGSAEFTAADVDYDGKVTASDARLILRAAVGLETLSEQTGKTEYDILRSGTFSLVATMEDETGTRPMNMAVGKNGEVYMETEMDGVQIGILIRKETVLFISSTKMYMLNIGKKTYADASLITTVVPDLDLESITDEVRNNGFTQMPPLSAASSHAAGEFEGTACEVYTFESEETGKKTNVYLAGSKLIAIEQFDGTGALVSRMRVESVTAGFPAFPPEGYTKQDILTFITDIEGTVEP